MQNNAAIVALLHAIYNTVSMYLYLSPNLEYILTVVFLSTK